MMNLELVFKGDKYFKYEDLTNYLPKADMRFVIYDFEYKTYENPPRHTSKLLFIQWRPMTTPLKKKWLFDPIVSKIKNAFGGIQKDIFVDDLSDLQRDIIEKELNQTN